MNFKHPQRKTPYFCLVILGTVLLGGCTGSPPAPGGNTSDAGVGGPSGTAEVLTRLARLSHRQFDRSLTELFGYSIQRSSEFVADPIFGGYDNDVNALRVDGRLGRDYQRVAERVAAEVSADEVKLSAIVSCDRSEASCPEEFVKHFGRRVFRRELSSEEYERYRALFDRGAELIKSGDSFKDGTQLLISALLQSPYFLYRIELKREAIAEREVLNDWEIASRLAFLLSDRAPSEELLDLAAASQLHTSEQIEAAMTQLLESKEVQDVVLEFHRQWLEIAAFKNIEKDQALYPGFGSQLGPSLQSEVLEFVRHVSFQEKKGYLELMTAPYTVANETTAPLYGQSLSGSEMVRLDFTEPSRRGLFSQVGFLASHAYADASSPIHRGTFLLKKVLCSPIPPPPGTVDFTLSEDAKNAPTKRKQVEIQTGEPGCAPCHSVINPIGFAFEGFDAVGGFRSNDGAESVDTTGSTKIDGKLVEFQNAGELLASIAESKQAQACYAKEWLRFALGHELLEHDESLRKSLAVKMADVEYSPVKMLSTIVLDPSFRSRPLSEQE